MPLFDARPTLLGEGLFEERLVRCVGAAHRFVSQATVDDLLADVVADVPARQKLATLLRHVSHVGFLVPPHLPASAIARLLREHGLSPSPETFPSTILAYELGALVGRERLPTTVVKAEAADGAGCVELFLPDAPVADVHAWAAAGVGAHVSVEVANEADLAEATDALRTAGFRIPAFMAAGPMSNPNDGMRGLYLDVPARMGTGRVELVWTPAAG